MIRKSLVLGIVFLFIATSVSPMVVGYYAEKDESIGTIDGPMESPWPMSCHDIRHTSRSSVNTNDNTGDEIWKFRCHWVESGPVIDKNYIIYFGDFSNEFFAINFNGTLKWQITLNQFGGVHGSTAAIDSNGTLYVGSWDDHLHAIYPNGTKKWMYDTDADISSSPAIGDDGTIYFGTLWSLGDGGKLYAIHENGTEKWNFQTGDSIRSDPAIGDDGTIYFGSADTYLYAVNPNGTLKWRFKTNDWVMGSPSIAYDGTIYVGSFDGYLYAIYHNGTLRWKCNGGTGVNPSIGNDGTIYVGSIDFLYAVYPSNGTKKWTFDLGGNVRWSSPAISADGTILIGIEVGNSNGGELIAINPNGTERWRNRISDDGWISSSPAIAEDGKIFIGSTHHSGVGYLHAIGRRELESDAHGPYLGIKNEPVQFTGSADGGYPPYDYLWSFGDGETSEEQNPIHEYASAGNYTITLTVTDDNNSVAVDITWALIRESNDPPSIPIIDGETHGYYGEPYDYTFIASDIDGDDVWYFIEWGDGDTEEWLGPYSSGEEVIRSHTWDEEDTYTIRAKTKDIFYAQSEWGTLEVTMPVNQQYQYPIVYWLLERFPNLFPILRHTLQNWGVIV